LKKGIGVLLRARAIIERA